MADITSIFGGPIKPLLKEENLKTPEEQMLQAIADYGYVAPQSIVFDGLIHRFSTDGRKKGNDGWYVAFDGRICAGAFGSWKESNSITWCQDIGRELSVAEQIEHTRRMKEVREQRQKETERKQETAADSASTIWSNAAEASVDHPYLQAKQVDTYGLRVTGDGRLVVPVYGNDGELINLQFIDSSGEKRFMFGGKIDAGYFCIHGAGDSVYLAEGFATAASIHEATGATVFASFNAGNLPKVAKYLRSQHSGDICIVADNDQSGTGEKWAREAAKESRCRVIVVPDVGMDANDYAASYDLASLLSPPDQANWLVSASDFTSQPRPLHWLIKGFLPKNALIMLHGPSGGGKTFTIIDMCCHISSGNKAWFGHKVRGRTVVYLAGEGHHGLAGRLKAWMIEHEQDDLDMYISRSGTDLNTPDGINKVHQAIGDIKPDIIVVDTLHRFMLGDENSAQDAKVMLDACAELMNEYDCSVVLVHHTGVSDESQHRARGSSAWRGALDAEFSVIPGKDEQPMEIVARKMKDAELPPSIFVRLKSVALPWTDEDGDTVTSAVIERVTDYIKNQNERKHSNAVVDAKNLFETCWRSSGCSLDNGMPYINRLVLVDQMRADDAGESDDAAVRQRASRTIQRMKKEGLIETPNQHILVVKDAHFALVLKTSMSQGMSQGCDTP